MIDLTQLPAEGASIDGTTALLELGDGTTLRDASWRVRVVPSGHDFFMEVKGRATWEGACSRCLEPLELAAGGSHALGSQDLDLVFLPELVVDEAVLAREHFLLHAPMHPLCREECLGLCPGCGKNWNKGPCTCKPELLKEPGALAKALAGLKLNLEDA